MLVAAAAAVALLGLVAFAVYRGVAGVAQRFETQGVEAATLDLADAMLAHVPPPTDPPDLSGDVNARGPDGSTRLIAAVESGNRHAVELLLRAGADPNGTDARGETPLGAAVTAPWRGSDEIVRLLLGAGARAEGEEAGDLLATAGFRDRREILAQLLDAGIPIDARDEDGESALMGAAKAGRSELVRTLLARGADPALQDIWGYTALTWSASQTDNPETVAALLSAGAPVDALDDKGRAALLHAASHGRLGAVRALLEGGADPRRRHPELGTARECACPRSEELAALLEDAEQRLGDSPIPEPRPGHRPPLTEKQQFKKLSRQFLDAALENQEEARRMLAATPALLDSHALDSGETPLHLAANEGRLDAVRFLAGLGAEVDARDDAGDTPLLSAVYLEQIEVLELLISLGASPNVVSEIHDSALECAVRSGNVRSVELLLDAGASPAGLDLKDSLPEDSPEQMTEFLRGRGLLR